MHTQMSENIKYLHIVDRMIVVQNNNNASFWYQSLMQSMRLSSPYCNIVTWYICMRLMNHLMRCDTLAKLCGMKHGSCMLGCRVKFAACALWKKNHHKSPREQPTFFVWCQWKTMGWWRQQSKNHRNNRIYLPEKNMHMEEKQANFLIRVSFSYFAFSIEWKYATC